MALQPESALGGMFQVTILLCLFESFLSILLVLRGMKELQHPSNIDNTSTLPDATLWKKTYLQAYTTYFSGCRDNSSIPLANSTRSGQNYFIQRTFYWLVIYLVINTFWMVTSILLIFAQIFKDKSTKCSRRCLYYAWVVNFAIVIFADVFASIQYLLDLLQMNDRETYFKFTGCDENSDHVKWFLDGDENFMNMAPITMFLVFSRGIVLWLVNVTVLLLCVRFFHRLLTEYQPPHVTHNKSTATVEVPPSAPAWNDYEHGLSSEHNNEIPFIVEHRCNFTQPIPLKINNGNISIRVNRRGCPVRLSFSTPSEYKCLSSNVKPKTQENIELSPRTK